MTPPADPTRLRRLVDLVARLRAPDGCPWDREQELRDLRPYLLEEAHEAAAAVDSGDWGAIREELGDLLFQVAFLTCLGEEAGELTAQQVVDGIERKMIDRHPHVFGGDELADAGAVREAWEKRKERTREGSLLEGVPDTLPALVRAYRVTQKAAGVGFDWTEPREVLTKLREELDEVEQELDSAADGGDAAERLRDEIGDVLFTVANLARHLQIDPEAALGDANRKFQRRFEAIEGRLEGEGLTVGDAELEQLEALWCEVKKTEASE